MNEDCWEESVDALEEALHYLLDAARSAREIIYKPAANWDLNALEWCADELGTETAEARRCIGKLVQMLSDGEGA